MKITIETNIAAPIADARMEFIDTDTGVTIRQVFDAELTHPEKHQRADWQAVLDRFARHVERQCGTV